MLLKDVLKVSEVAFCLHMKLVDLFLITIRLTSNKKKKKEEKSSFPCINLLVDFKEKFAEV